MRLPQGAVSRLLRGAQQRIATGLPSLADPAGIGATGSHGLDFHGRNGLLTIGLGANRDGLIAPTSVVISKEGDACVSNCGVFPGSGPYPATGTCSRSTCRKGPKGGAVTASPTASPR